MNRFQNYNDDYKPLNINSARKHNEPYRHYVIRRARENAWIAKKLKGMMVFSHQLRDANSYFKKFLNLAAKLTGRAYKPKYIAITRQYRRNR